MSLSNVYIIALLLATLVACGEGTLGPLPEDGLAARNTLRGEVDWRRGHGSADTQPLDALIDMQTYYERTDSTNSVFYYIEAQMIGELGLLQAPKVSINDEWMSQAGNGHAIMRKEFSDTDLVFTVVWPDTTISIPTSILSAAALGADTLTYNATWSKSARTPMFSRGQTSDSIGMSFTHVVGVGRNSFQAWDTLADRGTFNLPSRIADSAKVGDTILTMQYRSYYRVIQLTTPTSGYGDRVVGILQRHRIPYKIIVVP